MSLLNRLGSDDTTVSSDVVNSFRQRLLAEADLAELTSLSPGLRRVRLERMLAAILARDARLMSSRQRATLTRQVVDEALGLGVLEPLLADETVTEIMINGPHEIYVERGGRIEQVAARFTSTEQLYQTIDRIVAGVNRRVDESSPMVDARLSGGERVNVIVPPLALNGPVVTIRRFPTHYTMEQLIELGTFDELTRDLLECFVRARLNIVISGGTGTGKTTMLNALSTALPYHERIVTVEDSAELKLKQPHVIRLEARPPNTEGAGQVTIRDLMRNCLRMRPDRIIVGEVRGEETLDMLQAMNTGHEGSLATVHANSADDAVVRLETLASMGDVRVPADTLRDQINSAVDIVVQLSRGADGGRRISEISTLTSRRSNEYRLASLTSLRGDDRISSRLSVPHLPEKLARRITFAGEPLPDGVVVDDHVDERGVG